MCYICSPDPYGKLVPQKLVICKDYGGTTIPNLLNLYKVEYLKFPRDKIKILPTFMTNLKYIIIYD
jgi:hypothetical protein